MASAWTAFSYTNSVAATRSGAHAWAISARRRATAAGVAARTARRLGFGSRRRHRRSKVMSATRSVRTCSASAASAAVVVEVVEARAADDDEMAGDGAPKVARCSSLPLMAPPKRARASTPPAAPAVTRRPPMRRGGAALLLANELVPAEEPPSRLVVVPSSVRVAPPPAPDAPEMRVGAPCSGLAPGVAEGDASPGGPGVSESVTSAAGGPTVQVALGRCRAATS